MWEQILDLALNNGLWAVLFLALLIYQLKDSRTREQKYQETITELNKTLNKVNKIDENVSILTESFSEVKENLTKIETSVAKLTKKKMGEENESKNDGILE